MSFIVCNWGKLACCTIEERREVISYIDVLTELKCEIERKGIPAFDNYLSSDSGGFERFAISLVSNGYSPDICASSLSRGLNISCEDNKQYLKNAIFSEFVLILQEESVGIQELRLRLYSYLGVEFMTSVL